MKIKTIEPTPNPNGMKLVLDEKLPMGKKFTYTKESKGNLPENIQKIINFPGVKSIFQVSDFITVERLPGRDWEPILNVCREVLGVSESGKGRDSLNQIHEKQENLGEVRVWIQFFKDIPMLIKVVHGTEERRVPLPDQFQEAIRKARPAAKNFLSERNWKEQDVRYGELTEVGEEIREEVLATYPGEKLNLLVDNAFDNNPPKEEKKESTALSQSLLKDEDWKKRFAALKEIGPDKDAFEIMEASLEDTHSSIRRLACVYLGLIRDDKRVFKPLIQAMNDKVVSVRRTAGDALNDLGDKCAIPAMIESLKDTSKLVRWRAARFLFELGDESALEALKATAGDPAFEVRMQVEIARERIEKGEEAAGTLWQKLTRKD